MAKLQKWVANDLCKSITKQFNLVAKKRVSHPQGLSTSFKSSSNLVKDAPREI